MQNGDTIRTYPAKTDSFLEPKNHVLRVRFKDELPTSSEVSSREQGIVLAPELPLHLTHKKVHESCLHRRMQVYFRLLNQQWISRSSKECMDYDWNDLA
jgi:hypothetical protein